MNIYIWYNFLIIVNKVICKIKIGFENSVVMAMITLNNIIMSVLLV